jgi:hypothetical protein
MDQIPRNRTTGLYGSCSFLQLPFRCQQKNKFLSTFLAYYMSVLKVQGTSVKLLRCHKTEKLKIVPRFLACCCKDSDPEPDPDPYK